MPKREMEVLTPQMYYVLLVTIYFLFIMIKNVDISILSADYILVDFAFWHTFDIFCFENIVYSI